MHGFVSTLQLHALTWALNDATLTDPIPILRLASGRAGGPAPSHKHPWVTYNCIQRCSTLAHCCAALLQLASHTAAAISCHHALPQRARLHHHRSAAQPSQLRASTRSSICPSSGCSVMCAAPSACSAATGCCPVAAARSSSRCNAAHSLEGDCGAVRPRQAQQLRAPEASLGRPPREVGERIVKCGLCLEFHEHV